MLEAAAGASTNEPHTPSLGVAINDEMLVGAVLVLADSGFE